MYTVYQEEMFGLWGLVQPEGTREEATFDTEGDAQDYADAYNTGCTTQEEVETFLAARAPTEPEPTPEERLAAHRQDLATIRKKIERAQDDGRRLEIEAHSLLTKHDLDVEAVQKKRDDLLKEAKIPERAAKAESKHVALQVAARELEDLLKEAALTVYALTEEKHLGGVDIKANKTTTLLVEAAKAIEYGKRFCPKMIRTTVTWKNKRSFFSELRNRLTKEMDDEIASIVELIETPSATIAKNLSEYLAKEPEETPIGFMYEEDIPF